MRAAFAWALTFAVLGGLYGFVYFAPVATFAAASAPAAQWNTYHDPAGFSIAVPAGWRVTTNKHAGRVTVQGKNGERAVIWPTFLEQHQLDVRSAETLVEQLAAKLDPQLSWGSPEASANFVRVAARGGQRKGTTLLSWSNAPNGAVLYVYSLSAPAAVYRASVDTFTGILKSFQIEPAAKSAAPGGASGGAFAAPTSYVPWMEPHENVFTLSVPQGWKVSGGAYRLTATDVRKGVNIVSPDGHARVMFGDADIPAFSLPTQMGYQLGMREGSYTSIGDGSKLQIRRYLSGQQFAREYAESKVSRGCSDVKINSNNNRPDLTQLVPQQRIPGVARMEVTGGDVTFSCMQNGRLVEGYVAAVTRVVYSSMQGGIWYAETLFGSFAPPGNSQQVRAVAEKIAASFHLDSNWEAREKQIASSAVQQDNQRSQQIQQRALRAIEEDQRATSDMIVNDYNQRQAVYDEISRKRENAILGTVDVVDPSSGTQYKIDNYSDYHWMDNQGNIAGTKTADSPGVGWRQMVDLP
jgi:uncharacterized protein YbdZ (MbtH family)